MTDFLGYRHKEHSKGRIEFILFKDFRYLFARHQNLDIVMFSEDQGSGKLLQKYVACTEKTPDIMILIQFISRDLDVASGAWFHGLFGRAHPLTKKNLWSLK